jgi:tetratricopeptide (TPR) repeat protein
MKRGAAWLVALFAAGLASLAPRPAAALADTKIEGQSCGIANSGSASNATVNCNFGLTPEQLKQAIDAAVKGATGPLVDRITDISKTLGVTEDAAKTLLKIVGEDANIPEDKLAEALTKVAGDFKRLQAQAAALNPENAIARALVDEAKPEIDAGHFARAHDLLRQATQAQIAAAHEAGKLEEQARAARDAQMLGAAGSTAAEGDVALTERRYLEAAALFEQAAGYVPADQESERGAYLTRQAGALYRQGEERGDNDALRHCVDVYGSALAAYPRAKAPRDWARAENNLGIALETLGERESGTTRLEESVAAYRAALEERTRQQAPLDWGVTQSNLGYALERLGERESGTARLEEAVAATHAALEELKREQVPLDWAMAQNSLGVALTRLGERESGAARLHEAVAAFRAALEEQTRERAPLIWAMAQTNLGAALFALGQRESGSERFEEAIAAFRTALEERTRERTPLGWASTQNDLGNALSVLAMRTHTKAPFGQAVTAYRAAMEELTRERAPLDWATAQHNLAIALYMLGEDEGGTARLQQAVDAFQAALEERTPERVPLDWAASVGAQAVALMLIADRTDDGALANRAVTQLEMAYETAQAGGQQQSSAAMQALLSKAQAIRDRIKGQQ